MAVINTPLEKGEGPTTTACPAWKLVRAGRGGARRSVAGRGGDAARQRQSEPAHYKSLLAPPQLHPYRLALVLPPAELVSVSLATSLLVAGSHATAGKACLLRRPGW